MTMPARRARRQAVRRHPLCLAVAAAMLALPAAQALAQAASPGELPRGGTVTGGSATLSYNPGRNDTIAADASTTIAQSSKGAIIDWGSFSIGAGNTVNLTYSVDGAVTLNRVVGWGNGPDVSLIQGAINAPGGTVFLVNQAGVTFAGTARVNVGGIVASTLDISNAAFNTGVGGGAYVFSRTDGAKPGLTNVQAGATITVARPDGTIALLGGDVNNDGTLSAASGNIGLVAGQTITLDPFGDGLTQFTLTAATTGGTVANTGSISADGGTIDLLNSGDIYAMGSLRARTEGTDRGRITVNAGGGTAYIGMRPSPPVSELFIPAMYRGIAVDVSGDQAGEQGGTFRVSGLDTAVVGTSLAGVPCVAGTSGCAIIDASGLGGGGTVQLLAARNLWLWGNDAAATGQRALQVRADGLGGSNGGNILAYSLGLTLNDTTGAISILGSTALSASAASAGATGGSVQVANNGGDVTVQSSMETGVEFPVLTHYGDPLFQADGGATGGTVALLAAGQLIAGAGVTLSATGGQAGGNIGTRAYSLDLRGLTVDAGGDTTAGQWVAISANDLAVVHGDDGTFGEDNSLISDTTIAGALSAGSNVTLQVPAPTEGSRQINIAPGVDISADNPVPVTFSLLAPGGQILAGLGEDGETTGAWRIAGSGAAMNLVFEARSTIGLYDGTLATAGGLVSMTSHTSTTQGIELNGTGILTSGGDVSLDGGSAQYDGVSIADSSIDAGAGALSITGASTLGASVRLYDSAFQAGALDIVGAGGDMRIDGSTFTAQGALSIRDTASYDYLSISGSTLAGDGIAIANSGGPVQINTSTLTSSAAITVNGRQGAEADAIRVYTSTLTASGDITLAGDGPVSVVYGSTINAGGALSLLGDSTYYGSGVYIADSTLHGDTLTADGGQADTRIQGSTLSATGDMAITGHISHDGEYTHTAVSIDTSTLTSGGDLRIDGTSPYSTAIAITGSQITAATLHATGTSAADNGLYLEGTGLTVAGLASLAGTGSDGAGVWMEDVVLASDGLQVDGQGAAGVVLVGSTLDAGASAAAITGVATASSGEGAAPAGVWLSGDTQVRGGAGGLRVSGWAPAGAGIQVDAGSTIDGGEGVVVLRAGSPGASALQVDGTVSSLQLVNLRMGGVDGSGQVVDDATAAMILGGQFASMATLGRLLAPTLVAGHAGFGGAITVAADWTRAGNLTLQNDAGTAGITLAGAVDTGAYTLALSSGGDIRQQAGAGITAHSLLVRAGGTVVLDAAANHLSGDTLAGSAGGDFTYLDGGALSIGPVNATGMDASGTPSTLALAGIAAGGNVLVRNQAGDMTLRSGVSGNRIDLVTAGRLLNTGGASLAAADSWRVWAATWEGETRGGLAGSGNQPNFYNCTWSGACGVTVPAGGNHFIYTAQPTLTITIDDLVREYGLDNPALAWALSGLVLGDDHADQAAAGALSTAATAASNVGTYAIGGTFTSSIGYAVQVLPGTLSVTPATLTYVANPLALLLGQPFGVLGGTVTGFRNGDTLAGATSGSLAFTTSATGQSLPGTYEILGGGLEALNYVFVQAPANYTALDIGTLAAPPPSDYVLLPPDNYVYDLNIGRAPTCPAETPEGMKREEDGDVLGREWARVRSRPNLMSCVSSKRENGCGDF